MAEIRFTLTGSGNELLRDLQKHHHEVRDKTLSKARTVKKALLFMAKQYKELSEPERAIFREQVLEN